MGLSRWPSGKESANQCKSPSANVEDSSVLGSILDLGKSPGGGHGSPLQYSWLENPMDRGAWQTTVQRVAKSQARLRQLSTHTRTDPKYSEVTAHRKYLLKVPPAPKF